MTEPAAVPWLALALLGATHGINPGMGWLFAAALGLQEGSTRAVLRALGPLAAGHAVAVAATLVVAAGLGLLLADGPVRVVVAGTLAGLALHRLLRGGHPRYGGMRVGPRELAVWSALMAGGHGAGWMVVPAVLSRDSGPAAAVGAGHAHHAGLAGPAVDLGPALAATLAHTAGYLLVAALVAVVVQRRVGVAFLRRGWINLDRLWAGALLITAAVTLAG